MRRCVCRGVCGGVCGGVWGSYLGVDAAVRELQVGTVLVTDGTHDDVSGLADLLTDQSQSRREAVSARGRGRVQEWDVGGNVHLGRLVDPGKRRSCEQGHIRDGTTAANEVSDVGRRYELVFLPGCRRWRGRIL